MRCGQFRDKIEDLFKNGKAEIPAELLGHAGSCPECSAYQDELFNLKSALDSQKFVIRAHELEGITFESIKAKSGADRIRQKSIISHLSWIPRWGWIPATVIVAILGFLYVPQMINVDHTQGTDNYAISLNTDLGLFSFDDIFSSDSLSGEFIKSMADSPREFDQAEDELMKNTEISEILQTMSEEELSELYNKLENINGRAG